MRIVHQNASVRTGTSPGVKATLCCSGFIPALAWISGSVLSVPIDFTDPRLGQILAGVVILEAIVILKLLWGRNILLRRARSAAEEDGKGNLAALYSKALTGSLDRFSVGEVLQFLNSIRETGILDILDDRVSTVHRLLIEEGDIIDAYNGDQRGERAVQQILQCREGTFTFIRGDLPSNERVIQKSTMTLLMEAYQQRDENGEIESGNQPLFASQG